jgi:hypothetical protein
MKTISRCGAIVLICCLLMALLPLRASAGTYDIFTYEIKDNQVTITGCAKNTTGKVVIPDTIEGCPVTAIGEKAFYQQGKITEIILPDTVNTIGKSAFALCEKLTTVNLPSGLTVINSGVFATCPKLTSLHIPSTVTNIDTYAFNVCDNLSSLTVESGNPVYYSTGNCVIRTADKAVVVASHHSTIPADGSVTTIATNAFKGQSGITDYVVPHGITTVENGAFDGCIYLRSFHISDTVTSISSGFASNSLHLSSLTVDENNPVYHSSGNCIIHTKTKTLIRGCKDSTLPADGSITAIGKYAFSYVRQMTTIALPTGITSIGRYAFANSSLSSIQLPDTLVSVEDSAFNGTSLSEITFPTSVNRIDQYCLTACKNLQKVTILNPNAQIGKHEKTFYGDVTIYGYTGSTAEAYATEYGKTFVALDPHTCSFDQKVSSEKYLSAPASCTAPAKYFYSCTCGEKGTKTFTHGEALPHTYDNACDESCNVCNAARTAPHSYTDEWKNDDLVHWHECTCGAKNNEAAHTWDDGAATDAETVIYRCNICNAQRVERIETPPEVTEPTVPSDPEPITPTQTEPTITSPAPTEPSTPEQDGPSVLWVLPLILVVLALLILIIFLLKRKKEED